MNEKQRQRMPVSPGRPKSVRNKITGLLKDAILKAATNAGGGPDGLVMYLEKQAVENPAQFITLLGKVLPMQVGGIDGDAIKQSIRVTIVDPNRDA